MPMHMKISKIKFLFLLVILLFVSGFSKAESHRSSENKKAVYDLIQRVLPSYKNNFEIEFISKDVDDKDVFEIETVNGKIITSWKQWHLNCQCIKLLFEKLCSLFNYMEWN